jgi:hypothetical protein
MGLPCPALPCPAAGTACIETPNGDRFVKPDKCLGLLPEILTELLAARKR